MADDEALQALQEKLTLQNLSTQAEETDRYQRLPMGATCVRAERLTAAIEGAASIFVVVA